MLPGGSGVVLMVLPPIPQDWIRGYVDQLLVAAKKVGPGTLMGQAALLRADHAMDMVKAWREYGAKGTG